MRTVLVALATLSLATGALAADRPKARSAGDPSAMTDVVAVDAGSCFRMSQIRNHKKLDASTLLVSVGSKSVYRWEMLGNCLAGVSSSDPLIMTPVAGTDMICRPIDLDLKVRMGSIPAPCIIKSFKKLTPDEVAALPAKARP